MANVTFEQLASAIGELCSSHLSSQTSTAIDVVSRGHETKITLRITDTTGGRQRFARAAHLVGLPAEIDDLTCVISGRKQTLRVVDFCENRPVNSIAIKDLESGKICFVSPDKIRELWNL